MKNENVKISELKTLSNNDSLIDLKIINNTIVLLTNKNLNKFIRSLCVVNLCLIFFLIIIKLIILKVITIFAILYYTHYTFKYILLIKRTITINFTNEELLISQKLKVNALIKFLFMNELSYTDNVFYFQDIKWFESEDKFERGLGIYYKIWMQLTLDRKILIGYFKEGNFVKEFQQFMNDKLEIIKRKNR